jgi:hypothetical protein
VTSPTSCRAQQTYVPRPVAVADERLEAFKLDEVLPNRDHVVADLRAALAGRAGSVLHIASGEP